MSSLTRREEETLVKATKSHALKACDSLVREFAECATGRTVSVTWACRTKYQNLQECIYQFTRPESMELVREEYLKVRNEPLDSTPTMPS